MPFSSSCSLLDLRRPTAPVPAAIAPFGLAVSAAAAIALARARATITAACTSASSGPASQAGEGESSGGRRLAGWLAEWRPASAAAASATESEDEAASYCASEQPPG